MNKEVEEKVKRVMVLEEKEDKLKMAERKAKSLLREKSQSRLSRK